MPESGPSARTVRRGIARAQERPQERNDDLEAKLYLSAAAFGVLAFVAAPPTQVSAQTAVAIDNDDIGGVVTGPNGPEAGVWVIAETTDLPTRYAKMVVTDDQGRYVVPDLPKAQIQGLGARLRPRRFAESGRRARQAAQSARRSRRRTMRRPRNIIRRSIGIRCSRSRPPSQFGGKSDIPAKVKQSD